MFVHYTIFLRIMLYAFGIIQDVVKERSMMQQTVR